jgi:hypothetical protein
MSRLMRWNEGEATPHPGQMHPEGVTPCKLLERSPTLRERQRLLEI